MQSSADRKSLAFLSFTVIATTSIISSSGPFFSQSTIPASTEHLLVPRPFQLLLHAVLRHPEISVLSLHSSFADKETEAETVAVTGRKELTPAPISASPVPAPLRRDSSVCVCVFIFLLFPRLTRDSASSQSIRGAHPSGR